MIKNIPPRLEFAFVNLRKPEESSKALKWYGGLRVSDRQNVYRILKNFDFLVNKDNSGFGKSDFYVLNAVGSSLRGIKAYRGYTDIDLLLATNQEKGIETRIFSSMAGGFDVESDLNSPDRILLKLHPKKGSGRYIHFMISPSWTSEDDFDAIDSRCGRVVLYRIGDTSGYAETMAGVGDGLRESSVPKSLDMNSPSFEDGF